MKIKVNKYQYLDNYEIEYHQYMNRDGHRNHLTSGIPHEFETENVTVEQLLEYIGKGYGIKINC